METINPIPEIPVSQSNPPQNMNKKIPVVLIATIIALLVITSGVGWAFFVKSKNRSTIRENLSVSPTTTVTVTPPITSGITVFLTRGVSPTGTVSENTGSGSICGLVHGPSGGNISSASVTVKTLSGKVIGTTTTNSAGEFTISTPGGKLVVFTHDNTWLSSVDQVTVPQGVCQKMYIILQSTLDSGMGGTP